MPNNPIRIFSLDPTTKGFGYVVFELPFRLVEWGLARIAGEKYAGAVSRFERLLDRFRPDAVVLEDATAPGARRDPRVRRLIDTLVRVARDRGVRVSTVARKTMLEHFTPDGERATKHSVARRLAEFFPELAPQLPPPRKPWQSQDERMAIFDALAFAVTYSNSRSLP